MRLKAIIALINTTAVGVCQTTSAQTFWRSAWGRNIWLRRDTLWEKEGFKNRVKTKRRRVLQFAAVTWTVVNVIRSIKKQESLITYTNWKYRRRAEEFCQRATRRRMQRVHLWQSPQPALLQVPTPAQTDILSVRPTACSYDEPSARQPIDITYTTSWTSRYWYQLLWKQCSNGERRRTGTLCLRTPKARGVSMQLGCLGSAVSSHSGSGRSPAAKRHLVHFWSENALSAKALNAARGLGSAVKSPSGSGRSPAAKRHLLHFWSEML